jgi:hypothetical protein
VMPRYSPADPIGYRPIRWLWDLQVPQDPPYVASTYRSVSQMDPVAMINRIGPFTKNFPTIGVNTPCMASTDCDGVGRAPGINLECVTTQIGTPTSGLEADKGGARCDVSLNRFGEFCAPAIAGCVGSAPAGPDADFVAANKKKAADDPLGKEGAIMGGYTCHPNTAQGGYCMLRCDSEASTSGTPDATEVSVKYKGPDGQEKTDKGKYMGYDKRCGNLPGYKCLNPAGTAVPTTLRVCLRSCDGGKPDTFNDVYCQLPITDQPINERTGTKNIQQGQKCSTRGLTGASGCQWDPAYEPRDSKSSFTPL